MTYNYDLSHQVQILKCIEPCASLLEAGEGLRDNVNLLQSQRTSPFDTWEGLLASVWAETLPLSIACQSLPEIFNLLKLVIYSMDFPWLYSLIWSIKTEMNNTVSCLEEKCLGNRKHFKRYCLLPADYIILLLCCSVIFKTGNIFTKKQGLNCKAMVLNWLLWPWFWTF